MSFLEACIRVGAASLSTTSPSSIMESITTSFLFDGAPELKRSTARLPGCSKSSYSRVLAMNFSLVRLFPCTRLGRNPVVRKSKTSS